MQLKCLLSISLLTMLVYYGNAQEYVLDSAYYDLGVVLTEDFENQERRYFRAYDEQNRPLIIENQRQVEGGIWENWRRREFTYSDDGDPIQLLTSFWQASSESWVLAKGRNYSYDGNSNLVGRTEAEAMQEGEGLTNTRRWQYTYEGPDLQTAVLFQRWEDSAWRNVSQQQWSYNANGLPTNQLRQSWDGSTWQDARRRMWDYDSGVVSMVTEQFFDDSAGEWINERRVGYQGNGSVRWNQSVEQVWDDETQGWQNVRRELIDYHSNGSIERQTLQFWEDGEWLNILQSQTQLTDDAINVITDEWNSTSTEWELFTRYQLRYNEAGLKIVEQGWQYWSEQMSTWLNATDTERWRYFWSEIVVDTEEPVPSLDCRWPNPYQAGQTISCADLSLRGSFTLELVNSIGQVVYQQQEPGGADFQIRADLPKGWYVCRIQQDGQLLHVQPLVFIP
ncbi:MAG: hypothetical protein AAFO02_05350 [Bacteroidota bacterium]